MSRLAGDRLQIQPKKLLKTNKKHPYERRCKQSSSPGRHNRRHLKTKGDRVGWGMHLIIFIHL